MKNNKPGVGASGQIIIGVMVMAAGCLFLADNLGLAHFDFRFQLWPTLLIVFGVLKIAQTRTTSGYLIGGALLAAGLLTTFRVFGFIHLDWGSVWPLLVILAGVSVILKAFTGDGLSRRQLRRRRRGPVSLDKAGQDASTAGVGAGAGTGALYGEQFGKVDTRLDNDATGDDTFIDATAILGSYKRRIITPDFRGGEITAIMGGCELDLRQSSIQGDALLDVFAVCGGITLKVPPDWTVVLQGTPLLGGFEEKTILPPDTSKRLVVRGYAIMGGVEVRN